MDVHAYLNRIGVTGPISPDLDGLRTLHRAHLQAISYENLDVQLGRTVTTAIEPVYEKIIEHRRGGWCYEMNGLLGWALKQLGFDVMRCAGGVMREAMGDFAVGNHLVLRIRVPEGLYLADVGFGDGPLDPIQIVPGDFNDGRFRFSLSGESDDWWRFHNHPYGGAKSFDFRLVPADENVLTEKCMFLQSAVESPFVQNLVCQRHTTHGLTILRGRVLRKTSPVGQDDWLVSSADELLQVLHDEFGLDVPAAAELWPLIIDRHASVFGQTGRKEAAA